MFQSIKIKNNLNSKITNLNKLFYRIIFLCLPLVSMAGCILGEDYNWHIQELDADVRIGKVKFVKDSFYAFTSFNYNDSYGKPLLSYQSSDGINWTNLYMENPTIGDLIFINGTYLALCVLSLVPGICTSSDLSSWSLTYQSSKEVTLNSLVWGNSMYIAVGNQGAIFVSADLITWNTATTKISEDLDKVEYGNGEFVALGHTYQGNSYIPVLYNSTDGMIWNKINLHDNPTQVRTVYYDLTYGKNGFIMAGEPDNYYSRDGLNWYQVFPRMKFSQVTWCDSSYQYVAVSSGGGFFDAPRIFTSSDGENWMEHVNRKYGGNLLNRYIMLSVTCHDEIYVASGYSTEWNKGIFMSSP